MKKILCLIDGLGDGGAERQMVGLAVLLKKKGYKVDLAYYHKKDFYVPIARQGGIEPILLNVKNSQWSKLAAIWNFIKKQDHYECVITYKGGPNAIGCLLKLAGMRYKLIVSERNSTQHLNIYDKQKFWLYKFADYVVPNSISQSEFLAKLYPWMKTKIVPITNFTDILHFAPNYKQNEKKITILTVARIDRRKNILNYLEAISKLKEQGMNGVHFEWYGNVRRKEEDYAEDIKEKIAELRLMDFINFHSSTINIAECYQKCDIFCLPSSTEGFPNVICEAMSCGKPIICSRICDNPFVVSENGNGMLFDPENPNEIAEKLKQMIEMSKENRENWGRRSREIAIQKFSEETFVNKYIKIIEG